MRTVPSLRLDARFHHAAQAHRHAAAQGFVIDLEAAAGRDDEAIEHDGAAERRIAGAQVL